jgi:hypothetical protein
VPGFVEFTDALVDLDIIHVKQMLSKRGLQGTDSWTKVMSILFPDCTILLLITFKDG